MSNFVLIPGAWLGGWAWDGVAERLRALGHGTHAVSLPGLGEEPSDRNTGMESYIGHVVDLIECRDLHEVVLVGHSFGGVVAGAVADRVPDRISRVVYVDAGPLPDGMAFVDLLEPEQRQWLDGLVAKQGDGWLVPMPPWEELETRQQASAEGMDEKTRERVRRRSRPQPFLTWTEPVKRNPTAGARLPKTLIACTTPIGMVKEIAASGHPAFAELAGEEWSFVELPTGHWPMFSRPLDLANALAEA